MQKSTSILTTDFWLLVAIFFSFKTLVIIWKSQEESLTDFCYTIDGIVHTNFFFPTDTLFFVANWLILFLIFCFDSDFLMFKLFKRWNKNFRFVTLKNLELPFGKIKECYNYVSSEHEPFLCYSVVFHFKHIFFFFFYALIYRTLPNAC